MTDLKSRQLCLFADKCMQAFQRGSAIVGPREFNTDSKRQDFLSVSERMSQEFVSGYRGAAKVGGIGMALALNQD